MKYNNISTGSLPASTEPVGPKKSSFTIYADMDISHNKMANTETEIATIREELEKVQKALKVQTRKCQQLVVHYTRKLQQKEKEFQSEKSLRDDQLAKVLRALIIFESRLKQEQKLISHQLKEKDYVINKQSNEIKRLLTSSQYCKNCNQYYNSHSPNMLESLDSSSEYVVTTDYQSSNFESLDSSSDIYATISEKSYNTEKSTALDNVPSSEDNSKVDTESTRTMYMKNKGKDSIGRRGRKVQHRKSVGTYFEVLKLRNDNNSSQCSNEDNTSNDLDNLDSLPPESVTDKTSVSSESTVYNSPDNAEDAGLVENDSSSNLTVSECNSTVINKLQNSKEEPIYDLDSTSQTKDTEQKVLRKVKITESIPVFEGGDGETNDIWYAMGSDHEDEEQRGVYRNNPVLECMNQILLQNINDSLNSPPKTPNMERKPGKNKKVKFSDEEDAKQIIPSSPLTKENLKENLGSAATDSHQHNDYYETPIQKVPNFYETPQSIYSNDYEQILSRCSETFSNSSQGINENFPDKKTAVVAEPKHHSHHHYIDLDTKAENAEKDTTGLVRKAKISRTPPALPPKPANLVLKYKPQSPVKLLFKDNTEAEAESEPDYCSISELNLPTSKSASFKKISVVAEINPPNSQDVLSKIEKANNSSSSNNNSNSNNNDKSDKNHKAIEESNYDPVGQVDDSGVPVNLVVKKCVEKFNIQLARQTSINNKNDVKLDATNDVKNDVMPAKASSSPAIPKKNHEPEIPKLPQVSEIIIPDETEDDDKKQRQPEDRISHDNYVKNNSQILKLTKSSANNRFEPNNSRRHIVMGTSVSNLISGFNNQLLSEINKKPADNKGKSLDKKMFSSFENLQNLYKQTNSTKKTSNNNNNNNNNNNSAETPSFDKFDLSQNFEEFKLDDCEIEEYNVDDMSDLNSERSSSSGSQVNTQVTSEVGSPTKTNSCSATRVELIRATNDLPPCVPNLNRNSVEVLKKRLELQTKEANDSTTSSDNSNSVRSKNSEPTYEHFLESYGLSSKSILTPSRLLSNHKSMLKPKDIKLRSKVKGSNNLFERHSAAAAATTTSTVKYWSEPYI